MVPQVINDLKLSRKKCTQIIKNVLGKHETEKLIINLKSQKFSNLIDESTTICNDKLLYVLVKYVLLEIKKCIIQIYLLDRFIRISSLRCNSTADKLYSTFENYLKSKRLPLSNIIGNGI